MKNRKILALELTILSFFLVMSVAGLNASAAGYGKGSGGGGGGGGGSTQPDYSDLFVLYRDASGIPILTPELCQQPIASEVFPGCNLTTEGYCLIPLDLATCTVLPEYATYTQEVEFGRTSAVRSPDSVINSQLEEALLSLNTAGCISLDPAGRLVYSSVVNGVTETRTIDSSLQNLAIYRELMTKGDASRIPLQGRPWLDMAAKALGAASDKEGKVSVDMVIYINQILGLTEADPPAPLVKQCIDVREEVMGKMETVQKCFLTMGGHTYNRTQNFLSLPSPKYIPAENPQDGWFEYLYEDSPGIFMIKQGPILGAVPELQDGTLEKAEIGGFAQAADDTRAVIQFMHSWPVIGDMATPVQCEATGDVYYDLSINADSGLQVPVRMVAGTEGREGSLTITNAGPATASGTVTLIGRYGGGFVKLLPIAEPSQTTNEDVFSVTLRELSTVTAADEPVATFFDNNDESFTDLPAGSSKTWSFSFSIDTATTIVWEATVSGPNDVNPNNDAVVEETKVTASRGGRGK